MTARTSFRGSFTALVTPFANGTLDEKACRGLVDWQIAEGTDGLVPVGTTGESPTLSHEEHRRVVEWCVAQAKGRVPVVAGAGSNSTTEAIAFSRHAEECGADAVLVVTPYYNKPTQEGLYQHYKAINDAVGIPILIYNIPARSVIDMSVDTMKRLFELRNIAGVKDATANVVRVSQQRAAMGEGFNQLSGEDASAIGFRAGPEYPPAPRARRGCSVAGSSSSPLIVFTSDNPSAPAPATGLSAWAASDAELSGPVPPMAAAVAMMIVMEMTQANSAPEIASIRARG